MRWITAPIWLPLLWLGQAASALGLAASVPLLKAAWAVSGDGDTALLALRQVYYRQGPPAADRVATDWLARRPRPQVAAFAGLMACHGDQLDQARQLMDLGQQLGGDPAGALETLELAIAERDADPSVQVKVAERLALRSDLPPNISKTVLGKLMWDSLLSGRFVQAGGLARRLLAVDADPQASIVTWALSMRDGNPSAAAAYLQAAQTMPADRKLYCLVLADHAIGRREEAEELLAQLRERNADLAEHAARSLTGLEAAE